ncbi:MAG: hypothetical protein V3U02_12835, partial [Calditrichia bacterium]
IARKWVAIALTIAIGIHSDNCNTLYQANKRCKKTVKNDKTFIIGFFFQISLIKLKTKTAHPFIISYSD